MVGDFNAKLLERPPNLEHAFGNNILKPLQMNWDIFSDQVTDKRIRFIKSVAENDFWVSNTFFTKPIIKTVTHRPPGSTDPLNFAHAGIADQVDYVLAQQRWKTAS